MSHKATSTGSDHVDLPVCPLGESVLHDAYERMSEVRAQGFSAAKIEAVPQVTRVTSHRRGGPGSRPARNPHAWNMGTTTAAAVHLSAASDNCPFVEYLPPSMFDTGLRRDLLASEPEFSNGVIALPSAPGLGVELDPDAVAHYRVASVG